MLIDQSQLNPELFQMLKTRQSLLKVVKTTTTPGGQTLDWIPIESQLREGTIATPPPVDKIPVVEQDTLKPTKAAGFELDDPNVERGPAGTVPILRPDLSLLTKTVALQDFLSKRGGLLVNKQRPNKNPTDPNPFGYFHAISSQSMEIYGCEGYLNLWDPAIDTPASPGDDHSIMQTWLQNYDKPQSQSIEAGWSVDKLLNGDTIAHLFTYYTTNGYSEDGNNLGGYNRIHSGWVQYSPTVFPGIRMNGVSAQDSVQLEFFIKFQLYNGNWWFGFQGGGSFMWIGYYPASLFGGGLGNYAEWVGFGGEVYSSLANPSLTKDQMGSGRQAQDGWTNAAFQKNLRNQSDANGDMVNHNGVAETDTANGGSNPYTIQMYMNSGSTWGSYFFVGGPAA